MQYSYPTISSSRPVSAQYTSPYASSSSSTTTSSHTRSKSSEFKGSTNPSEDWTKISDLAERRRIQNRIAQRNYRKKLKRRLEDLERRAKSRDVSPGSDEGSCVSSNDTGRHSRESSTSDATVSVVSSSSTSPVITDSAIFEYSSYGTSPSPTLYPSQCRNIYTGASSTTGIPTIASSVSPLMPPVSDFDLNAFSGPYMGYPAAYDLSLSGADFPSLDFGYAAIQSAPAAPKMRSSPGYVDEAAISPYTLLSSSQAAGMYDNFLAESGFSNNYYSLDSFSLLGSQYSN